MFASGPWPDIKVQFWPAKGQKLEVLYSKKKKKTEVIKSKALQTITTNTSVKKSIRLQRVLQEESKEHRVSLSLLAWDIICVQ